MPRLVLPRKLAVWTVLGLAVVVLGLAASVAYRQWVMKDLRRGDWYAVVAPEFTPYCRIRSGTPVGSITKRFGPPTLIFTKNDPKFTKYVYWRTQIGWSTPPTVHERALVYEVVEEDGFEMIVVYLFIGPDSRVLRTFVSET